MRILHLTSDWKWTGPAAPMLELLLGQRARGHEVALACPAPPPGVGASVLERARAVGADPVHELSRGRGLRWGRDAAEARFLADLIERCDFRVIHTWHTRDHLLALRAASTRRRSGATQLVRSYKGSGAIPPAPWNRWLFGPGTDGMLCVSQRALRANVRLRGGRPIAYAFGAVDLERFRPAPPDARIRASLSLEAEHRVVGIVARAQRHRRFDLLLEAMARLAKADDRARLVVIGRGTHIRETAHGPAERLGLSDRVVFAGYRSDDYVDTLRALDVFTLLVPGSDGGCRALLEAAACGLPAVTTGRGALPEIVLDGETGVVAAEEPDALAAAWGRLLADPALRGRLGAAARRRAQSAFSRERLADAVDALYRAALDRLN